MASFLFRRNSPEMDDIVGGPPAANEELPEFTAFRTVMWYIGAIIVLPVTTLFICKRYIFDNVYADDLVWSNIYSAICAIVVLHVALGAYIFKAYSKPDKITKTD